MYVLDPKTDTADTALRKLAGKVRFIDGLVRMGEESYEIEYDVMDAAKLAIGCLAIWQVENKLPSSSEDGIVTIMAFFEFVYLFDHPRRMMLYNVTKKGLKQFFTGQGADMELEIVLRGNEARTAIAQLYFMLAEAGYPGVARPLRFLRDIKQYYIKEP